MNHATHHRIHHNTMNAWRELDLQPREQAICRTLEHFGKSTDRQIAEALQFSDMNSVRPMITGLIDRGVLTEVGETECPRTHRNVRVVFFGDGTPRERGPTLTDRLMEYFKTAERERTQMLRPSQEWNEAAEAVQRLI